MKHEREDYKGRIVDLAGLIPEDEPIFLLRAQDTLAPDTVDFWARMAQFGGADGSIIAAGFRQADAMREWQKAHGQKMPDMPSPTPT